jgi:dimethylargininase
MDRLFDFAFVRKPSNSYVNCVSSNSDRDKIDVTLAKEQHGNYISILKECGVNVIELPALEEFPDSVFMQDPGVLGTSSSVIGRFGEASRRGEEEALVSELEKRNVAVGEPIRIHGSGTLEGGDIMITDQEIFVGQSSRTNVEGARQLAQALGNLRVFPVRTNLFHLLCSCAYLNKRTMIIAPELIATKSFPGFQFVTIPKEEVYATDALYLGEDQVLIPSGYPKAKAKLVQAGYKPIEVDVSEFYKGDGGVTCLSSPIYKTI